ncbi:putative response regulator receiver protein [Megalodesulfovibrio gigas DSM 1382 = ATCC 19364]|uniref:Putative response regulator receiver protein n=1 Tax=Megalodesulfovibrio gigas (strain ATCC 19364 / DSM 1382 / NCIMB 9332 / VKM B-1759) TaxID=1121448 RepID=T2GBF9_MEGG1|nr:putative response regulator receiver protein [Megalodesulfovibrio gigas DSM 1382 = ATCC 19364]
MEEIEAPPVSSPVPAPAPPAPHSLSRSLVVVDDEPHIRMLMEEALEELEDDDVRMLFARDGQEGLELIRRERPRLVFLDVMMPRMNGYQVCERVKGDPDLRGVCIVMLSAKGQEVDRIKGEAVGADLYMTKPFSPMELLATARRLLGLARAAA